MSHKINLINGNIITLEESCPIAETISINNGKIAEQGSHIELLNKNSLYSHMYYKESNSE